MITIESVNEITQLLFYIHLVIQSYGVTIMYVKNTLSNEQINEEEIIHNNDFYATINAALKERDHETIKHNTNNHH